MPYHYDSHMMFPDILRILQHCAATCEHMTTYLLSAGDVQARATQLKLLRDCADICTKTAKFIARSSGFSKSLLLLCAHVCEVCGNECMKFPDAASRQCGQICLNCARECRAAAAMAA